MKYLPIYLNDHYLGATAGSELAKRAARNNRDAPEFGPELSRIAADIDADYSELQQLMHALGVKPNPVKGGAGWVVEKLGRLKPNGELLKFSPLSRLVEIEGLITGVSGKLSLWRVLLDVQDGYPALDEAALTRLADRAEEQRERLLALRGAAAKIACMP
jgi:hypothetical protein